MVLRFRGDRSGFRIKCGMTRKMKIAIISDTHDNLATLEKAVDWINKNGIEEIIHCGDICSPYTLQELSKKFSGVKPRGGHAPLRGKIHLVFGNVDPVVEFRQGFPLENPKPRSEPKFHYRVDGDIFGISQQKTAGELPNVILYGEIGEMEVDAKRIAFAHHPKIAKLLAQSGKYDLVFYGHTHQPMEEKIGNCLLINPGNLSNMLYKATFAVYNTENDELELKVLEKLEGDTDMQMSRG